MNEAMKAFVGTSGTETLAAVVPLVFFFLFFVGVLVYTAMHPAESPVELE